MRQAGTYWYHAHSHFQEQTGLFSALVIDPAGPERHAVDRDYVVMLNDWTDQDPARIYTRLKKRSDYYNLHQPTVPDFLRDAREPGLGERSPCAGCVRAVGDWLRRPGRPHRRTHARRL